jgi:hypothetical protein
MVVMLNCSTSMRGYLSLPKEPCVLPQTIIGLKCRVFNSELSGIAGTMRNVVKREKDNGASIESALQPVVERRSYRNTYSSSAV